MSVAHQGKYWWSRHLHLNDSYITSTFCGQIISTITCGKCGGKSRAFDPFYDLSLEIPKGRGGGPTAASTARAGITSLFRRKVPGPSVSVSLPGEGGGAGAAPPSPSSPSTPSSSSSSSYAPPPSANASSSSSSAPPPAEEPAPSTTA